MNIQLPPNSAEKIIRGLSVNVGDFVALRRDLHAHPELAFEEHRTSAIVAQLLEKWGYEVTRGLAGTGVVGTLRRGNGTKALGIRADMDALPIEEQTGLDYASKVLGKMHACGHDGHTTILLASAKYLAEESDFSGTLHLIFQPAEEIGGGASKMISEGLFERFPVDAVFGLHNWPNEPAGKFGFVSGPAMASIDKADIRIVGKGGHGAAPHQTVDPVVATAHVITALQSIVSRGINPLDMAVVTVGSIHGGQASNVIPESVELRLTTRSYLPHVRTFLQERVPAIARAQAESFGAVAEVDYELGFPSVINHAAETELVRLIALRSFGLDSVISGFTPRTASEDFSFMLLERPGSYIFVGNGESASLHSAHYNFNDEIIVPAAALWVALTEAFLQEKGDYHG